MCGGGGRAGRVVYMNSCPARFDPQPQKRVKSQSSPFGTVLSSAAGDGDRIVTVNDSMCDGP